MTKGIMGTGRGFDLPGRRLGGSSRQPPLSSLHQNALTAAENRVRRGDMLPSGPKRIGGDSSIMATLSPIQAAGMAAERRLHDDVWCGSKSLQSEGFSETSKASVLLEERSIRTSPSERMLNRRVKDAEAMWQCITCTLLNQVNFSSGSPFLSSFMIQLQ